MSKTEVLAPVGNVGMLKAAVFSGADSIYCGLQGFNARQGAGNFTAEELKQAVRFCHARNVKVNVTLNTLLYDNELDAFLQSLQAVCDAGADAVIVQDMAAAQLVKKHAPGLQLHGSTQMAVHTLEGAKLLKELGFHRVILARELPKEKVQYITQHCGIETEIFVHGALCMALSGQCYMSAFLGGRSGNRGRCAGTCRLPFAVEGQEQAAEYALSLKDLSLVRELQEIEDAEVACVKIEGRMRTPEYVAAAITACKHALQGETFDSTLLEHAFSRSGFTDGFYKNDLSAEMFGVRTEQNMADTKQTLPQLRELYRRELQKVPVCFALKIEENKLTLKAQTAQEQVEKQAICETQPAQKNNDEAHAKSLAKTGGTPFFASEITVENNNNLFVPNAAINALRSALIEELLQKREEDKPLSFVKEEQVELFKRKAKPAPQKTVRMRFAKTEQIPLSLWKSEEIEWFILPIKEVKKIPEEIKGKTVLELPRAMFDGTDVLQKQMMEAVQQGFPAFEAENLGHIPLVKKIAPEALLFGGFTLNVANNVSVNAYEELGLKSVTISPELALQNINNMAGEYAQTGILAYGHLPLMLTRACPLRNARNCAQCKQEGYLIDRKNAAFFVHCADGASHIYNPIPLYMADRLQEVNCDFITLYFVQETQEQVEEIWHLFKQKKPFEKLFTRGLYYKGAM